MLVVAGAVGALATALLGLGILEILIVTAVLLAICGAIGSRRRGK